MRISKSVLLLIVVMISCNDEVVKLDRPINFSASKGDFGNRIVLSWERMPGVNYYRIARFNDISGGYENIIGTSDTFAIDSSGGLLALTKTYYKVMSYNSENEYSDFSDMDFGYITGSTYDYAGPFYSSSLGIYAEHIATDRQGSLFVVDNSNNKVHKFSSAGDYQGLYYSVQAPRGVAFTNDDRFITTSSIEGKVSIFNWDMTLNVEWGIPGTGDGQFGYFRQVCLDDENMLYVVDHTNFRIQKFRLDSSFVTKWDFEPGNISNPPWGIVFFKNQIIVSSGSGGVRVFDKSGNFIRTIDQIPGAYDLATDGNSVFFACGSYILRSNEALEVFEKIGVGDCSYCISVAMGLNNSIFAGHGNHVIRFVPN